MRALVFDVAGRRVATLVDRALDTGVHTLRWNGAGPGGRPVPAGVYFLRIEAPEGQATRKLLLLR